MTVLTLPGEKDANENGARQQQKSNVLSAHKS